MINTYKLKIRLVNRKEVEVVQKAPKTKRKRWVNNFSTKPTLLIYSPIFSAANQLNRSTIDWLSSDKSNNTKQIWWKNKSSKEKEAVEDPKELEINQKSPMINRKAKNWFQVKTSRKGSQSKT